MMLMTMMMVMMMTMMMMGFGEFHRMYAKRLLGPGGRRMPLIGKS